MILSTLISLVAVFAPVDGCDSTAPIPTAPVCVGVLDWTCMSNLEAAFTSDWNTGVGTPRHDACVLQLTVPGLQATIDTHAAAVSAAASDIARWAPLCAAGNPTACLNEQTATDAWNEALDDWADATTALATVNGQITTLNTQALAEETSLLADFFTDADACCSGFLSAGPVSMPVAQVGDVFACPPVYPGLPPAALCDIPETYRAPCLALAKFRHKTGWENYVRTFSLARCSALDAIIDKLLEIQGHELDLDALQDEYDDEVLDCIIGVPGACDRAQAIAVQMVTIQGWINDLNVEITALRNSIAGYESAMTLNMADIATKYFNATAACCGPEDEDTAPKAMLVSAPASMSVDTYPCPYTYPGPPEATPCPVESPAPAHCLAHARASHYFDWITNVVPSGNQRCYRLDDIATKQLLMLGHIEDYTEAEFALVDLDAECLAGNQVSCAEAIVLRAWMATTAVTIEDLQASIDEDFRWVGIYEASMASHLAQLEATFHAENLACCGTTMPEGN